MPEDRDDQIIRLLEEMRDLQREHLDEHKQFASLAIQTQLAHIRLYKRVVAVAGLVIAGLLFWLWCWLPD